MHGIWQDLASLDSVRCHELAGPDLEVTILSCYYGKPQV